MSETSVKLTCDAPNCRREDRLLAVVTLPVGKQASAVCPACHSTTTAERLGDGRVLIATKRAKAV